LNFIILCTIFYGPGRLSFFVSTRLTSHLAVAPVGSCDAFMIAIGCCWAVATPSTSLLFFFRIQAMFSGQRVIIILSAILWLATFGGSITLPFALIGGHIGGTDQCMSTSIKYFSSAAIIAGDCYNTLVFIAISRNIIMRSTTVNGRIRSFFGGRNLPFISRELLHGGQQCYLSVLS
jgi:hypothetical protein